MFSQAELKKIVKYFMCPFVQRKMAIGTEWKGNANNLYLGEFESNLQR